MARSRDIKPDSHRVDDGPSSQDVVEVRGPTRDRLVKECIPV